MATLTVRNIPDSVLARLKEMATRNRRSMEQEVRNLLERITMDHLSACRQIEESWQDQTRPTRADEVDSWLRQSRP